MSETNAREISNNTPLAGKVALVTGGTRGIGRAIAIKLASIGSAVAICGRDEAKLAVTEREILALGVRTIALRADVTQQNDVTKLVEKVESTLGPISILVNNAGMGSFGPVHEKTEAEWDELMNTNVKSVFLVSRAAIPGMIERGGGDIINISSLEGKSVFAGG